MIKITETAKKYIKLFNKGNDEYLRVACISGGCQGYQFKLSYTSELNKVDKEFIDNDIKIVMDFKSRMVIDSLLTIDYTEGLNGSGFSFDLKGASSCGCGISFSI